MDPVKVKEAAAKALQEIGKAKANLKKMEESVKHADMTAEAVEKALK